MKRIIMTSILVLLFVSISIGMPGVRQWRASWQPNTESDLAGYKIYYSNTDRSFSDTQSINVGNVTNYTLTGNIPDKSYICLTAYDLSGNESEFGDSLFFDKDSVAPAKTKGFLIEEAK